MAKERLAFELEHFKIASTFQPNFLTIFPPLSPFSARAVNFPAGCNQPFGTAENPPLIHVFREIPLFIHVFRWNCPLIQVLRGNPPLSHIFGRNPLLIHLVR